MASRTPTPRNDDKETVTSKMTARAKRIEQTILCCEALPRNVVNTHTHTRMFIIINFVRHGGWPNVTGRVGVLRRGSLCIGLEQVHHSQLLCVSDRSFVFRDWRLVVLYSADNNVYIDCLRFALRRVHIPTQLSDRLISAFVRRLPSS